jgi:glycosyltransferase involved in cell wall biosynthesis
MRIGFNATGINPNYPGGVYTYSMGLLSGLVSEIKDDTLQIYVTQLNKDHFDDVKNHPNIFLHVLPFNKNRVKFYYILVSILTYINIESVHEAFVNFIYRKWSKIMSEKSDVIYTPTTTILPYKFQVPTILSIHDVQQAIYPNFFSRRELLRRKITYSLSVRNSTYIQASSNFMKKHLLEYYKFLKEENIIIIPEGVDILKFSVKSKISISDKYRIPKKFLYFPAQLWPHKNHITLLRALQTLSARGVTLPLVMTGAAYSGSKEIFDYIKKHRMSYVYYLGKVPHHDVVALYQQAWYFITATLYESSSLPFLEAAAASTLIIASKTPPNIEMEMNIKAELFDPNNYNELTELLDRLWTDNSLKDDIKKKNRMHVQYYAWNEIAKKYKGIFNCILC